MALFEYLDEREADVVGRIGQWLVQDDSTAHADAALAHAVVGPGGRKYTFASEDWSAEEVFSEKYS